MEVQNFRLNTSTKPESDPKWKFVGTCSIATTDGLVIHGFKIKKHEDGRVQVQSPAMQGKKDPSRYYDVSYPVTAAARNELTNKVIDVLVNAGLVQTEPPAARA